MDTQTIRTIALTAQIKPASGGFGMWQAGTTEAAWPDPQDRSGDGQEDLNAFLAVSIDNGFDVFWTPELDGLIQFASPDQTNAAVYCADNGADEPQYFLLWVENEN